MLVESERVFVGEEETRWEVGEIEEGENAEGVEPLRDIPPAPKVANEC